MYRRYLGLLLVLVLVACGRVKLNLEKQYELSPTGNSRWNITLEPVKQDQVIHVVAKGDQKFGVYVGIQSSADELSKEIDSKKFTEKTLGKKIDETVTLDIPIPANTPAFVALTLESAKKTNVNLKITN